MSEFKEAFISPIVKEAGLQLADVGSYRVIDRSRTCQLHRSFLNASADELMNGE